MPLANYAAFFFNWCLTVPVCQAIQDLLALFRIIPVALARCDNLLPVFWVLLPPFTRLQAVQALEGFILPLFMRFFRPPGAQFCIFPLLHGLSMALLAGFRVILIILASA